MVWFGWISVLCSLTLILLFSISFVLSVLPLVLGLVTGLDCIIDGSRHFESSFCFGYDLLLSLA